MVYSHIELGAKPWNALEPDIAIWAGVCRFTWMFNIPVYPAFYPEMTGEQIKTFCTANVKGSYINVHFFSVSK